MDVFAESIFSYPGSVPGPSTLSDYVYLAAAISYSGNMFYSNGINCGHTLFRMLIE